MTKALVLILSGIISAILYRMGGSDSFNTKTRDMGVPTVVVLAITYISGWNWWLILTWGLMFGALTTYWKKKGTDATFIHYFLHGLGITLSLLPYCMVTNHWISFTVILLTLPVSVAWWSMAMKNAVIEELGRGAIIGLLAPFVVL